jgi:hypothetical protein
MWAPCPRYHRITSTRAATQGRPYNFYGAGTLKVVARKTDISPRLTRFSGQ